MSSKVKTLSVLNILILVNMTVMISDYKIISNKVGAVCTLLIMFLLLIYNHGKVSYQKFESRLVLSIFAFLTYYTATSLINGSVVNLFETLLYFLIEFSSIFIYLYFLKKGSLANQNILLLIFFIVWDFFCIIAIINYLSTPNLARLMAAYRASYASLIIGGGYPMAYGSAILSVYLLQTFLENKYIGGIYRFLIILEMLLLTVLVYFTNSFVILISMLLGYILCLVRHSVKGSLYIIPMVFLFTVLLVLYLNIDSVLEWLINITDNEFIEKRLYEIYNLVANDVTSFHLGKRSDLYKMSIDSFMQYPIFGVGYSFGNLGSLQRSNGVGAHSTIFDSLAQYGLLGAIPLFGIILYPYFHNRNMKFSSTYLISFMLMLFLNPCFTTYHCLLVVYLIIPIMQSIIEAKKGNAVQTMKKLC